MEDPPPCWRAREAERGRPPSLTPAAWASSQHGGRRDPSRRARRQLRCLLCPRFGRWSRTLSPWPIDQKQMTKSEKKYRGEGIKLHRMKEGVSEPHGQTRKPHGHTVPQTDGCPRAPFSSFLSLLSESHPSSEPLGSTSASSFASPQPLTAGQLMPPVPRGLLAPLSSLALYRQRAKDRRVLCKDLTQLSGKVL